MQNCNQTIADNSTFCPYCGTEIAQDAYSTNDPYVTVIDNDTEGFGESDIRANKGMAALSYLGFLFLIPLLAAKNSKFARFHVNQGLVLFIIEAAISIATNLLSAILSPFVVLFGLISWAVSVAGLVFTIIGIVNACQGKTKKLPVIGEITLLK